MKYTFLLRGEDHIEFYWDCDAGSRDDAYDQLDNVYPDATIIHCYDDVQRREIDERTYQHAQRMYDDPYAYDCYDWC
jgi:hypothetical protein